MREDGGWARITQLKDVSFNISRPFISLYGLYCHAIGLLSIMHSCGDSHRVLKGERHAFLAGLMDDGGAAVVPNLT